MCTIRVHSAGTEQEIQAQPASLLSDLLSLNGSFHLPCGGKAKCGRCRVRVSGQVSPVTGTEEALFSRQQLDNGWRLACLTRVLGNVEVTTDAPQILEHIMMDSGVSLLPHSPLFTDYGVAVDIGTTTVCATLLSTEGQLGTVSVKNPQTAFGADVISRIEQSLAGKSANLADCMRGCIGELAENLAVLANIDSRQIDTLVITGNTTMLYLLTGHSPESLSHAPFAADRLFGEYTSAEALGFPAPSARIYLPRCMSAFVGADITTAVLASGMCDTDKTAVLLDIGTNGEIALWHGGILHTCSTAAGPALEGVNISCGTYGVRGAVDKVWLDMGRPRFTTIGGTAPVGICGSGVVDAVAAMLQGEIIDETGAFDAEEPFSICAHVAITARDVREVQLAKGAIRAGLETLLQMVGVGYEEIDTLYIAGGFGNYLDLSSATAIGLIPPELISRTHAIGNAALAGAGLLLADQHQVPRAQALAEAAQTVHLDGNPVFLEQYMEHMIFSL